MTRASRARRLGVNAFALGALATSLTVWAPQVGAQAPDGLIVFESDRGGRLDLWVMNPDGSNQHRVTNDRAEDTFPEWSPDGSKIAWTRGGRGPEGEIWIMNADGSGRTRVTFDNFSNNNVTWSPDGERIGFNSRRAGNTDIFAIDVDGSNEERLTDHPAPEISPDWSPTGTRIAFTRLADACAVHSMRSDGSDVRQLTSDALQAGIPAHSPDGSLIAFAEAFCTVQESDVFVMRPDGTALRQVTDTPANEIPGAWSPDSTRTAVDLNVFTKGRLLQGDIGIVDMATGEVANITRTRHVNEQHMDWAPAL